MEGRMRDTRPMQVAKAGYIILSAGICALGALMLLSDFSIALAGVILGVLMLVFGVVKIIGYCSRDLYRLAFQYDLASGILMTSLGAYVLLHPERAMEFFYVILGVVVLADGLFKIQIAVDARQFGVAKWWLILILAMMAGTVGCVLLFLPRSGENAATAILGVVLLAEGMQNLSVALCTVKIISYQRAEER